VAEAKTTGFLFPPIVLQAVAAQIQVGDYIPVPETVFSPFGRFAYLLTGLLPERRARRSLRPLDRLPGHAHGIEPIHIRILSCR
jgi:hypothetical protein